MLELFDLIILPYIESLNKDIGLFLQELVTNKRHKTVVSTHTCGGRHIIAKHKDFISDPGKLAFHKRERVVWSISG